MTDIPKLTDEPEACMSGWEVEQPDMVSVPRELVEELALVNEIADVLARLPVRSDPGSELDALRRREAARALQPIIARLTTEAHDAGVVEERARVVGLENALAAFKAGQTYLCLSEADKKRAAFELDDVSILAWTRWAIATCSKHFEGEAREGERSKMEVMSQHAVIMLALLTLETNATNATFSVKGATYRGERKGDWQVNIKRTRPPASGDGG